jgi:hypothetical protein
VGQSKSVFLLVGGGETKNENVTLTCTVQYMLDMQGYLLLLLVENDVAFALLNKEISGFLSTQKTVAFMTSDSGYTDVNMCVIRSRRVSVDRQLSRVIIL